MGLNGKTDFARSTPIYIDSHLSAGIGNKPFPADLIIKRLNEMKWNEMIFHIVYQAGPCLPKY